MSSLSAPTDSVLPHSPVSLWNRVQRWIGIIFLSLYDFVALLLLLMFLLFPQPTLGLRDFVLMLFGLGMLIGGSWFLVTLVAGVLVTVISRGKSGPFVRPPPKVIIFDPPLSRTYPHLIPNGRVVLLRQRRAYGAIIFTDQRYGPEEATFQWLYRSDGRGSLDPRDRKVKTGVGKSSGAWPSIVFGSFSVKWSIATTGLGYLYYDDYLPGEAIPRTALYIALTEYTSTYGLDAHDLQWQYTARPPVEQPRDASHTER